MANKKPRRAKTKKLPPLPSFVKRAKELGAIRAKIIKASSIKTAEWVRLKCRFGCGGYGSSLCCPPHTPTPGEMREVIDCYKDAILFESKMGKTKTIAP
ncbi:MAG: DUF2284 domain-containing protein, partial [Planctomycetota bacterium]